MTLSLPARGSWQEDAACASVDPELWFPDRGRSPHEAKRICSGCEVKTDCLNYAITHDEQFGVWGGLSQHERHLLRRKTTTLRKECGTTSGYWRHRSSREPACRPCLDAMRDDGRRRRAQGTA